MKQLFSTDYKTNTVNTALLVLRIGIGVLMLVHGLPKMAALLSGEPVAFPALFGMSARVSLSLTVFAEVFCSFLLIVGFGTSIATGPLISTMLVAVLYVHGNDPFAKQELGMLYLLAYVLLLLTGAGKYSLDHLTTSKKINFTKRIVYHPY